MPKHALLLHRVAPRRLLGLALGTDWRERNLLPNDQGGRIVTEIELIRSAEWKNGQPNVQAHETARNSYSAAGRRGLQSTAQERDCQRESLMEAVAAWLGG